MTKRQVLRVDSVKLTRIPSKPAQVKICAYGIASTPGWTAAQLVPFIYIQAPPDGIYDFTLVALPPLSGATTQVLTPLSEPASLTEFLPDGFRGVRIHTLENKLHGSLLPESSEAGLKGADAAPELATHLKCRRGLVGKSKRNVTSYGEWLPASVRRRVRTRAGEVQRRYLHYQGYRPIRFVPEEVSGQSLN